MFNKELFWEVSNSNIADSMAHNCEIAGFTICESNIKSSIGCQPRQLWDMRASIPDRTGCSASNSAATD